MPVFEELIIGTSALKGIGDAVRAFQALSKSRSKKIPETMRVQFLECLEALETAQTTYMEGMHAVREKLSELEDWSAEASLW